MNIIGKLHILKNAVSIAREKFRESIWINAFQAAERAITTSEDEKKIASAQNFLAKNWRRIHAAGIDLTEIVQVMNPMDVIEQFEALQDAGAHLDIDQIVRSIPGGHGKIDLHRLHSLGADMDLIAIHDDSLEPCSFDEINDLIINGVSVQVTFDLSESLILGSAEYPDTLFKILYFFYSHGIDSWKIREMINKIIPVKFIDESSLLYIADLIDDIIEDPSNRWPVIGIKPKEYSKPWIYLHCDDYLGIKPEKTLANLPKAISIRDFIHFTGLPYIISKVNYHGLTLKDFIDLNYLPAGGDIEELTKEANYARLQYEDPIDWLTLAYLSDSGSKLVNRKMLLEYGDPSRYNAIDYDFAKKFMENNSDH